MVCERLLEALPTVKWNSVGTLPFQETALPILLKYNLIFEVR